MTVCFCRDDELGYLHSRTPLVHGEGLILEEVYRLAHLQLVAPRHPRVIIRQAGKDDEMGRHERTWSLVVPVPAKALAESAAYESSKPDLTFRQKDRLGHGATHAL
jgi:hypothetical protein